MAPFDENGNSWACASSGQFEGVFLENSEVVWSRQVCYLVTVNGNGN